MNLEEKIKVMGMTREERSDWLNSEIKKSIRINKHLNIAKIICIFLVVIIFIIILYLK